MATGNRHPAPKVKRTYVLAPVLQDDGRLAVQREEAEQKVFDLLGALWSVGGAVRIVADRVKVGTLPASGQSQSEPIGETVGLIIEYQANTPLNAESVTVMLEEQIYGDDDERERRREAEAEQAARVAAVAGLEDDDDDDEDGADAPEED